MGTLGVGFVGLGGIARSRHLPGFRALPDVEVRAVATSNPGSARRTAEELGIPRVHDRWQTLVADPAIDLVVVATWPDLHVPVTLAALAAGKDVLCQARLAMDLAGAIEVRDALAAHPGRVAMVVPSPFSLWCDATIARLIAEGTLGVVRSVRMTSSSGQTAADPWRRLRRHSGGNTLALGILYEALIRWLPDATAVTATGSLVHPVVRWPDGRTELADVPDHLVAVAELPGGILATIDCASTSRPEPDGVTIAGDAGSLVVTWDPRSIALHRPGHAPIPVEVPAAERREWAVEAEIVAAIRDGRPVDRTDVATAVRYMAFTDAVVDSLRTAARAVVPQPPGRAAPGVSAT